MTAQRPDGHPSYGPPGAAWASHHASPPGLVEPPQGVRGGDVVRAVVSTALGAAGVLLGVVSALTVVAVVVLGQSGHPARLATVALSVPQVREWFATELVAEYESEQGELEPAVRQEATGALLEVLARDELRRDWAELVVEGDLTEEKVDDILTEQVARVVDEASRGRSAGAQQVLRHLGEQARQPVDDGAGEDSAARIEAAPGSFVGAFLVLAGILGVGALVLGGAAVAVARHRAATAYALLAAVLLLPAVLLTTSALTPEWAPGWWLGVSGFVEGLALAGGESAGWVLGVLGAVPLGALLWRLLRSDLTDDLA